MAAEVVINHHSAVLQESDIDADSIWSRFRFLVPIMLGACHIMACMLWYVGTYNLPPTWTEQAYMDRSDSASTAHYTALLQNHWLGSYAGQQAAGKCTALSGSWSEGCSTPPHTASAWPTGQQTGLHRLAMHLLIHGAILEHVHATTVPLLLVLAHIMCEGARQLRSTAVWYKMK